MKRDTIIAATGLIAIGGLLAFHHWCQRQATQPQSAGTITPEPGLSNSPTIDPGVSWASSPWYLSYNYPLRPGKTPMPTIAQTQFDTSNSLQEGMPQW